MTATTGNQAQIASYVAKIKNQAKRHYAEAYAGWVLAGQQGDSPERGSLGYMGAQAVRMQIDAITDR